MFNVEYLSEQFEDFKTFYYEIFYARADPRIRDRFLMGNPVQIVSIYSIYIVIITLILPHFMKNRRSLDVRILENLLNLILLSVSGYFFVVCSKLWIFHYNWRCESFDTSESPLAMMVSLCNFGIFTGFSSLFEN